MGLRFVASLLLAMAPVASTHAAPAPAEPAPAEPGPEPAPAELGPATPPTAPVPEPDAPTSPTVSTPPPADAPAPADAPVPTVEPVAPVAPIQPTVEPVAPVAPIQPTIAAPPPHRPPPRAGGIAMFVGAAVVGGIGSAFRLGGTIRAISAVKHPEECGPGGGCALPSLFGGATVGTPLLLVSAGLLGGGMGLRGRLRAHDELFHDLPARRRPRVRLPLIRGLGWGLFGGGAGLWLASRGIVLAACDTDACRVGGWESTFYLSGAMVVAGMVLGPYDTAHRRYTARHRPRTSDVTLVPTASREHAGLSITGRF